MTITITLNGFEMTAPSQEALDAGWAWYNDPATTKQDVTEFCAAHGENIVGDDGQLVEDWDAISAIVRANTLHA